MTRTRPRNGFYGIPRQPPAYFYQRDPGMYDDASRDIIGLGKMAIAGGVVVGALGVFGSLIPRQ